MGDKQKQQRRILRVKSTYHLYTIPCRAILTLKETVMIWRFCTDGFRLCGFLIFFNIFLHLNSAFLNPRAKPSRWSLMRTLGVVFAIFVARLNILVAS